MATPTIIKVVINDDNRAIYKIEASCIDETSSIDWGDGIKTRVLPGVYVYNHEYAKNGTYTIKLNNTNLDKGWFVTEAIFGDYSLYLATCCLSGYFYEEQLPSILENVVLNEGLRVINYGALVDCTELKALTIPSTVVEIGQNAFDNCTSLEKVYIKAITPPERTRFGPSTPELKPIFADDDNLRAIYVPEGSVDAYKTAWYDYAHLIRRFPMFKIDEHIATITIEDEAVVQFSRQHPVYGIKGDNIKASFEEDFEDTDQGVYDTSTTGTTIMENHQQKDTIYLKGTGTVTVWAGLSAVNFPFKAQGKGGGSGGGTKYIGTTTTALSNGSTKNPIVVDGQSYTAQFGDIAVYNYTEFIFDGTKWGEFGRSFDTTPTNGSANAVTSNGVYELIHKGSGTDSTVVGKNSTASGYYSTAMGYGTYATGTSSVAMGSGTVAGGTSSVAMGAGTTTSTDYSVAMGHMTTANQSCMTAMGRYNSPNAGDLFNIGNGTNSSDRSNIVEVNSTSLNVNGDIKRNGTSLGDLAYKNSASGTANVSVTGTTDGSVTISPTKETIYSTTNKGTLPSFTYNSTTEELTFNAGTLPSTTSKSVVTNATATFTGASTTSTGTVNVTVS